MDGILIIDKPQWLTSHDVVLKLRRKLNQQKIGHAGTLDPIATGVLVLVLGRATKLVSKLINHDKIYEVCLTLGLKTDTGDITGKIIDKKEIPADLDIDHARNTLNKFHGQLTQIPPMVSAKKYKGRPLYKYARQGKTIPREPKSIHIYSLTIGNIRIPEISFAVHCSKGTYIRTLCEDIGSALGLCGCANKIRRIKNGPFVISQATQLDELLQFNPEQIKEYLVPEDSLF